MEIPSELVRELRSANAVCVLTGAGISAESGVPTFRDAQTGLWQNYDPTRLATPEAFAADPKLVWDWYAWRRGLVAEVEPNPAHHALAELEDLVPEFVLATQNVDGLHRRAGSRNVVELHGNIGHVICSVERTPVAPEDFVDASDGAPPACPGCGAFLRPDVVWFGEMLPVGAIARAQAAAAGCNVFLLVGTSGVVYPAAGLAGEAGRSGATVVEVNPERTPLSGEADFVLRGAAGRVLPDLVARLRE
ncbi:SIR2 family NAD-dependent protein deacylase [Rubrobacter indicoceani]|uniref:SIR2 family NAD-dependent protein deacylase n=1 Tax=Rubrobacter indicoceani TaxID=2051957 RepID=UPI000E5A4AAB|nr:NAD-dependent deacylase [Rubrobacter indicoceani]